MYQEMHSALVLASSSFVAFGKLGAEPNSGRNLLRGRQLVQMQAAAYTYKTRESAVKFPTSRRLQELSITIPEPYNPKGLTILMIFKASFLHGSRHL